MYFLAIFLSALLLLIPFQTPGDSFRKHYEVAEAYRRAGNLTAAEAEYIAILKVAYPALGRSYTAQSNYGGAVAALEAAAADGTDSPQSLVELAIAYFNAGQYASRNAAFQHALSVASGLPVTPMHLEVGFSRLAGVDGTLDRFYRTWRNRDGTLQLWPGYFTRRRLSCRPGPFRSSGGRLCRRRSPGDRPDREAQHARHRLGGGFGPGRHPEPARGAGVDGRL